MLPTALDTHLKDAFALIIVPPFAGLDRPSLGAHVLQACARARGFDVRVLYANMLLARELGEADYEAICFASTSNLLGERFFARAAYGVAAEVCGAAGCRPGRKWRNPENHIPPMGWEKFGELAAAAAGWADEFAARVAERAYPVVGCTTTFEQTAASVALLERVKKLAPGVVAIVGGANCEGPMAEGVRSLSPAIDFVFSGESEVTFPAFLSALARGERPDSPVVTGSPCREMDSIPTTDFSEYYAQLADFLPASALADSGNVWLPYESSRGCWWGEKHHCTFCGINGGGMVFREKSPGRVVVELRALLEKHPTNKVCMVDNIMPHTYFDTLLPRLAEELPGVHMFYEQKANLTFDRVCLLKAAGVQVIQPGIEALSTPLLRHMKKGVTAGQNIALLRYARVADVAVNWNLLYAFPGDRLAWYEETAELMPLLVHLNPPTGLCHLSIDRFSPYFERPAEYGVRSVRAMAPYFEVLPPGVDQHRIAYHFEGDYDSESRDDATIAGRLDAVIADWRNRWDPSAPALPLLEIAPISDDLFLLADTRGLAGSLEFEFIDLARASMALVGRTARPDPEAVEWALERKVCVELDGSHIPLATAPAGVLRGFESAFRAARRGRAQLPVLSEARPATAA